jgi:hypothetical protein
MRTLAGVEAWPVRAGILTDFIVCQSGIFGSSPHKAEPATLARADPARLAAANGPATPDRSLERYTMRPLTIVPT